tara:strand:+ start:5387 stop:5734 length:348 start_codon:yes stop_codon:yes gene_type:complete
MRQPGYEDREEVIAQIRFGNLSRGDQHALLQAYALRQQAQGHQRLADLVGRRVTVEFALPLSEWPFPGTPAHLHVYGVEGPLISLEYSPSYGSTPPQPKWFSLGIIKSITAFGQQ